MEIHKIGLRMPLGYSLTYAWRGIPVLCAEFVHEEFSVFSRRIIVEYALERFEGARPFQVRRWGNESYSWRSMENSSGGSMYTKAVNLLLGLDVLLPVVVWIKIMENKR